MSSEYINNRFEELGVGEDTKVRIIPSISGDDSELGVSRSFLTIIIQLKELSLLKRKIQFTYTFD